MWGGSAFGYTQWAIADHLPGPPAGRSALMIQISSTDFHDMFYPGGAQRTTRLRALAFAATAIGSFAGGTYHGFVTVLPVSVAAITWKVATIAVGVAACLLLSAALMSIVAGAVRRSLLVVVWLQFFAYLAWMLGHDDFLYVIIEYGSAMLVVFLLAVFNRTGGLGPARGWIIGGVCTTLAAAAIQQSGFDIHQHFNHNDLQHVVQMLAVWLLYQGGTRLADARVESAHPEVTPVDGAA
jgi:hypothetical protein